MSRAVGALIICAFFLGASTLTTDDVVYWTSPRVALLGDGIYANGGDLWLGNATNPMRSDVLAGGALYRLELGLSHPPASDLSNFNYLEYPRDPARVPFYVAGAMFASYGSLSTFGGMTSRDASNDGMYYYNLTSADPYPVFSNGSILNTHPSLPKDPQLWYRCCGAEVSVPNEDLAFYFGGLTASNGGIIGYLTAAGDSDQANTPSNDLIMCDVADPTQPSCETISSGSFDIKPRSEAEVVWLPYGSKGSLLVLGGISIPSDMGVSGLAPTYDTTNGTNNWMTDILIYDIASRTWMAQKTTGGAGLGQRASFCSIATASQSDGGSKSQHIYIYGGYDGTYSTSSGAAAYDDVWVLTLPAFQWTPVNPGTHDHRRQNHKCVKSSPNQFFSIGGNTEWGQYLNSSFMSVFDMNKLTWSSSYDPSTWSDYIVPDIIKNEISDLTAVPNTLTDNVQKLLNTPYQGTVKDLKFYPPPTAHNVKRIGPPHWFATTLGIVTYLTFATIALIAMVAMRRRMIFRTARINTYGIVRSNSYFVRWLHNATVKIPLPIEKEMEMSGQVHLPNPAAYSHGNPFDNSVVIEEGEGSPYRLTSTPVRSPIKGKDKATDVQVTTYERLGVQEDDESEIGTGSTARATNTTYERVNLGGDDEVELRDFPEKNFYHSP